MIASQNVRFGSNAFDRHLPAQGDERRGTNAARLLVLEYLASARLADAALISAPGGLLQTPRCRRNGAVLVMRLWI